MVFWVATPCSIHLFQHFRGTCCLHLQVGLNLAQVGNEVNVLPNFFYHPMWTPEGQELILSVCCSEHLFCFTLKRRSIYPNLDMNIHLTQSFVTSSTMSSTSILFKASCMSCTWDKNDPCFMYSTWKQVTVCCLQPHAVLCFA
jgi:hypothetical protein